MTSPDSQSCCWYWSPISITRNPPLQLHPDPAPTATATRPPNRRHLAELPHLPLYNPDGTSTRSTPALVLILRPSSHLEAHCRICKLYLILCSRRYWFSFKIEKLLNLASLAASSLPLAPPRINHPNQLTLRPPPLWIIVEWNSAPIPTCSCPLSHDSLQSGVNQILLPEWHAPWIYQRKIFESFYYKTGISRTLFRNYESSDNWTNQSTE